MRFLNLGFIIGFSVLLAGSIAIAKSTDTKKEQERFRSEVQSVLGTKVKTKYGEMTLRQRVDQYGRVRRQILVGKDFTEIQMDQNADGTADYYESTKGNTTLAASFPRKGRFLRLKITRRQSNGLLEAHYLLSLDGKSYNFLRSGFLPKGRMLRVESDLSDESEEDTGFTPVSAAPASIAAETVPDPMPMVSDSDLKNWMEHQYKTGVVPICENAATNRLAELQRDWWKILTVDVKEKSENLTEMLKASKLFDMSSSSCGDPKHKKDFEKIATAISEVMMTSSKGEPFPTDKTRGRYLRCLEQSGLGILAARMESEFLSRTQYPSADAPITCDWQPGKAGITNPAITNPLTGQVSIHLCLADELKMKPSKGSLPNYQNIMFHEFMHVGGQMSEEMTYAAQACCGDPSDDRVKSCGQLDQLVAKEKRFIEIETFLGRVREPLDTLVWTLANRFDESSAQELEKKFLLGLDQAKGKDGKPLGVFDSAAFSACTKSQGETTCRGQWEAKIKTYADQFFAKDCKLIVSGALGSQCSQVSSDFKQQLAKTLADAMINSDGISLPERPPGSVCRIDREVPNLFWYSVASMAQRYQKFTAVLIGVAEAWAAAPLVPAEGGYCSVKQDPDCPLGEVPPVTDPSTGLNPTDSARGVPITTPGGSDIKDVTDNRGSDSEIISSPYRPNGSSSALPITRVDSLSSGRSFAEDRYRRSTDFVGAASKAVEQLGKSLLPEAKAAPSERSKSPIVERLGSDDSFVAFRPKSENAGGLKFVSSINEARTIASLPTENPQGSGSTSRGERGKVATQATVSSGNGVSGRGAGNGGSGIGGGTASPSVAMNGSPKGADRGQTGRSSDVLEGLFSQPYGKIEGRLLRSDVIEALITRRINVQDAHGKLVGSTKPQRRYKFVGTEKPLAEHRGE